MGIQVLSRARRSVSGAVIATTLFVAGEAAAQSSLRPGWDEELAYAGVNSVLSGLVAGVFRSVSEEGSFTEGFWTGAAGGAVTYVGKRVTARPFDGAGILGRQIASVGGSMVSNARDGRGTFDRLTLQLGLGRLYWDRIESSATFRPDVVTIFYTARAVASDRVDFDWSHSLSAGTPVFVTQDGFTTLDGGVAGRAFGGVILIDVNRVVSASFIASHERTHVIQYDQQFALWAQAAERGIASLFGTRVADVVGKADFSLALLAFAPFIGSVPRDWNPLEAEADHLTGLGGW